MKRFARSSALLFGNFNHTHQSLPPMVFSSSLLISSGATKWFSLGTHVSSANPQLASMVDVSEKRPTVRTASACCRVHIPQSIMDALNDNNGNKKSLGANNADDFYTKKGPVLNTAVIAGTMAVKNTSLLIPFCHPLPIESCKITFEWSAPEQSLGDKSSTTTGSGQVLEITCAVITTNKTGIEMEALTGASVAGLCIYDMLKGAVTGGQQQTASGIRPLMLLETMLINKTGGKSDIRNVTTK